MKRSDAEADDRQSKRQKNDEAEEDEDDDEDEDDEEEEDDDDEDDDDEEDDDEDDEEAMREREAIVQRIRATVRGATADDVERLDDALVASFGEALFASIDEGNPTDELLDLIMTQPVLLRSTTTVDGVARLPVEVCCLKRNGAAKSVAEELMEYGAEASDSAYFIIYDALRYEEGGGGDFFEILFKSGYMPTTLEISGSRVPLLDCLCSVPDEYFLEEVFPRVLRSLHLRACDTLPEIGAMASDDGEFSDWARETRFFDEIDEEPRSKPGRLSEPV